VEAQPTALVAVTVNVNVPVAFGEPERTPPTKVRPAGGVAGEMVNTKGPVPPEAVKVCVKAVPNVPVKLDPVAGPRVGSGSMGTAREFVALQPEAFVTTSVRFTLPDTPAV